MIRLKANPEHPTYKKVERLIGLLEKVQLNLDWVDGALKIHDNEFCVIFDLVGKHDDVPQTDMPPTFEYKLTREKLPSKFCKCRFCDPDFDKKNI